jgi:hypothetical protein
MNYLKEENLKILLCSIISEESSKIIKTEKFVSFENYIKKLLENSYPLFKEEIHAGIAEILSKNYKIL